MRPPSRPGSIRFAIAIATTASLSLIAAAPALAGPPAFFGVDFVTASRGWAVGTTSIVRTTNGGKTWKTQKKLALGTVLNDVSFYGPKLGLAVGMGTTGTSYGPLVLRTTNAGRTWSRISAMTFSPSSEFYSVKLKGVNKGWACGGSPSGLPDGSLQPWGAIYGTTDGGRTWTNQAGWPGVCPTSLDFVNAWTGVAVGLEWDQATPSAGYTVPCFVTTTDGVYWPPTPPTPPMILGSGAISSSVNDVAFKGGGRVVAIGDTYDYTSRHPFVFTSNAWGTSWTEVDPTTGPEGLNSVCMATPTVGYVVGSGATSILKTTDGGVTWSLKHTKYATDLWGVDFVSATTGYAVGSYGAKPVVIKTTNGGRTWRRVK